MLTSKSELCENDFLDESNTLIKMQLSLFLKEASFKDADWDVELGYRYIYIIVLDNKTYTMKHVCNS